ncbi:glycosyltransferase family 4 protein [Cellulomonas iranensis]|uniref:glycosyltransferase family 4 protein n=1 Tax=Cellulomonas iranensis TaxID=76862 RepID=UPI0013D65AF3|nr:glycosyltransferase family 4 protein [Cellulomonas iranensis]
MHVLLVTHHYAPETGAPQRRWSAFVRRFVDAGHRVTVLAPPPHYPSGRAGDLAPHDRVGTVTRGQHGETVVRVRFRTHDHRLVSRSVDQAVAATDSLVRAVARYAGRRDRPDVVVATAPGLPSIPAGMAVARLLGRPVVVEMRDAWPDLIGSSGMLGPGHGRGRRALATTAAHRAMTHLQRRADAVVTTTVSFAEVLRERGARRVEVVRNGTSVAHLDPLPPAVGPAGSLRVLYLGTLGRSQGLAAAVKAADVVRERGVDLVMRVVGTGADEAYLYDTARRLGAPVQFVGRVPQGDVRAHYAWADTSLVSLRDWGPFEWTVPSKLYEALAVGRHVTASIAGEAARIITESDAGDVVAPQDPAALADLWTRLAEDRARLDVGLRGRRWVLDNADHDRLAAHYLDLLGGLTT